MSKLAAQVADALTINLGFQVDLTEDSQGLTLSGRREIIAFQVVRQTRTRNKSNAAQWRAHRSKVRSELNIISRLDDANKVIQDYVLVPASDIAKPYLTLSDAALVRHNAVRVETVDELIREIKARFTTSSHAAPAKPTLQNKRRKPSRPKTKNGRARR